MKSFRLISASLVIVALLVGAGCASRSVTGVGNEGFVVFSVEPDDAELWVDGVKAGLVKDYNGSRGVLQLTSGTHKIEIKKEGYQSHRKEVFAGAGAKQTISVRLTPVAPAQ
ncbi:MAG: PEGA domain-containing protein [Bdellovibrionota bacterium]